jgi:pimeloyl-[acyl-carrier protein] methyl ester esterase
MKSKLNSQQLGFRLGATQRSTFTSTVVCKASDEGCNNAKNPTAKRIFTITMGSGVDIVLLHGWGVHSGIWQFIAEKLAKQCRVTLVDLPGFGQSEGVILHDSLDAVIEQILAVTPQRAIWLGWSLGGLIATYIASYHPERVIKLISVASSPKFIKEETWPGIESSLLHKFADQLATDYEATLMRFLLLQFYGTVQNKNILRWLQRNLFTYGKPRLATLYGGLTLLEKLDLRAELAVISCPILYFFGRLDALVPVQVVEAVRELNPAIQCIIFPKASHGLFLSHEDEFLTQILQFL